MLSPQCQSLTKLLCNYEDEFLSRQYDLGTVTAIKEQIDKGNAKSDNLHNEPHHFSITSGIHTEAVRCWSGYSIVLPGLVRKKDG